VFGKNHIGEANAVCMADDLQNSAFAQGVDIASPVQRATGEFVELV